MPELPYGRDMLCRVTFPGRLYVNENQTFSCVKPLRFMDLLVPWISPGCSKQCILFIRAIFCASREVSQNLGFLFGPEKFLVQTAI